MQGGLDTRMNVLLDLDNTLINTLEDDERDKVPVDFQDRFVHHDLLPYGMRIFARPGLEEFLDFLFDNFNVCVYTAAEQEYALFIINNFLLTKPNRKVHWVFFRYHVELGRKRFQGTKDLRLLFDVFNVPGFYPCNTVIVDDLDEVHIANPHNAIPIKSFDVMRNKAVHYDSIYDNDLQRVQDVLKTLQERFENSECLRQIYRGQIPSLTRPF